MRSADEVTGMGKDEVIKDLKAMHSYFYQFDDDRSARHCEAIMCALTAVEKQAMKEPKVTTNAYGVKFYYCPHCERPLIKSGIIGEPRHCTDCGQAVKWE